MSRRIQTTYTSLRQIAKQHALVVVIMSAIVGIGIVLVTRSHAAAPFVSSEPENGTLSVPSTVVTDTSASGGKAVKFGSAGTGTGAFVHPGVQLNKPQLDYVKARITQEPWLSAFNKAKSSAWGNLNRVPNPVGAIQCGNGAYTSTHIGCAELQGDAAAAYTDALLWYYTDNPAYAAKSIELMNAWSANLVSIPWNGTAQYGNNKLTAGWSGANWTRAAEIIRYSNAGWAPADITRFEGMLTTKFLPLTIDGWSGGGFNWMTLFADVTMSIGVFTNNRAAFDNGVGDWRVAVPAHIYLTSDGPTPIKAPYGNSNINIYWHGWHPNNSSTVPWTFNNGETEETCRDLGHTAMGLASIFTAAETARIQGIDLYGEQQARLIAALEFQASNWTLIENKIANPNFAIPSNVCQGYLTSSSGSTETTNQHTGEIALNHFENRMRLSLPKLHAWVFRSRPIPYGTADLHMQAETLTNADSGSVPAR